MISFHCISYSQCFYCEDFEGVAKPDLPEGITTSSFESGYFVSMAGAQEQVDGFYTGNAADAGANGYWIIPEHTQFVMTNDDACNPNGAFANQNNNCDLIYEVLELPSLDFTTASSPYLWLQFEYYHDQSWGGGDAYVEISTNGGLSWTELGGGPLPNLEAWQFAAFDLSFYASEENVKIRFTWSDNGTWASGLAIDDIKINPLDQNSLILTDYYHGLQSSYFGNTSYSIVPYNQLQNSGGYYFFGEVFNNGGNTLDYVQLNASNDIENYFSQSDAETLNSLTTNTLICNDPFVPPTIGNYSVEIAAGDLSVGAYTDVVTMNLEVSDYEYARDDAGYTASYTSGSYVNNEGSQQRGNIFDIYEDDMLYAIKVRIHPATSPNCVAKGVLNVVDTVSGDVMYLSQTADVVVGQNTDDWMNFVFDSPIQLSAGDVVLATISADFNGIDTLVIAESGNSATGVSQLQDIDGVIGDPGLWYYTTSTPMVRLNFEPVELIYGCTDPNACNYNSLANISVQDNCIYYVQSETNIQTCDDYYTWNENVYVNSGQYQVTFINNEGCDSIATLNLTLAQDLQSETNIQTCDEYYIWNENEYVNSGQYQVTFTNNEGCDSIATLNLTINPSPVNQTIIGQDDAEPFVSYIYSLASNNNTYEWVVTNGNILNNNGNSVEIIWGDNGFGYIEVTETNIAGCYIIHSLEVDLGNGIENSWNCVNDACVDPLDGSGIFNDLNECESICNTVSENSWNCVDEACVDPLDGSGVFDDLNECEAICVNVSAIEEQFFDYKIYPNPSNGFFNIELHLFNSEELQLSIFNYLGEIVHKEKLIDIEGKYIKKISLDNKDSGIYILNITSINRNINQKIVIQ